MRERVERTAWRVPLPTRRFFVALALVAAAATAVSGVAAGWVASRNADTIDDAREQGLELATAVSDFRTNLASADARAAATLISGGLEDPESRAGYDADVLAASHALTDAALVATDDDRSDITEMADGLLAYAGLVETARANSRQGFPVGASYLGEARDGVNNELVPLAERQRRVGERRLAQAVNSVGGPVSGFALVVLVGGLVVGLGCAVLIAGSTRRVAAHPPPLAPGGPAGPPGPNRGIGRRLAAARQPDGAAREPAGERGGEDPGGGQEQRGGAGAPRCCGW